MTLRWKSPSACHLQAPYIQAIVFVKQSWSGDGVHLGHVVQKGTCEVDFVRPNMDIHVEKMLLLYNIPASSSTADALQEFDLVCCTAIVYLHSQEMCSHTRLALRSTLPVTTFPSAQQHFHTP